MVFGGATATRRRFLLPVKVLSALFRRLFLEELHHAHAAGKLEFFGGLADLVHRMVYTVFVAVIVTGLPGAHSRREAG